MAITEPPDAAASVEVTIRRFRLGDLGRVLEIERSSFAEQSYDRSTFLYYAARGYAGFFVAEHRGEVAGYILTRRTGLFARPRRGGITSVAVGQAYRRRGVGRQLAAAALDFLRRWGARQVDLEVSVTNEPAIRLYESLGFRRERPLPSYYGEAQDGMRMSLDLVQT
jgi:ribosomal-protein-alanine N-acetyltransferase